jgi:enhancer of mRNA-decapping protein 3
MMASSFIGYTVLVTLKSPPNAQIRGTISNVTGQRLTLQDGIYDFNAASLASH